MLDVLTITLNPAVDQTTHVDNFSIDSVNRISAIQNDPGGKGINVASYLASSNLKVGATGFLGIDNPSSFKKLFRELNIKDKFIYVSGRTRTNIKIIDEKNKTVTDLNQKGFVIDSVNLERLEKLLFSKKEAQWYVFSGSLPQGLDVDVYKRWIKKAHELGIKVALDASSEALCHAIESKPDLIKPNHHELSQLANENLTNINEYISYGKKLVKNGISTVCISMGKDGAVLIKNDEVFSSLPLKVKVNTTVGAGDAMLSGLILGEVKNYSSEKSLGLATAFSMSAVETFGPHLQSEEKIKNHNKNIELKKII